MDVKSIIKRQGFTLEQVAEKMGSSKSSVSQIINGNPTVGKLEQIANIIGCHRWEFFLDEMNLPPKQKQSQGVEEEKVLRFQYDCPHCGEHVRISIEKMQ